MADLPTRAEVVVVGAGIAGAATAYYLAQRNVDVILIDRCGPAAEASGGNAGMIGESGGHPASTMQLQKSSIEQYKQLVRDTGDDFGMVMDGRLRPALNEDEVAAFELLVATLRDVGIDCHMLYGEEVQALEPALSERVTAAAWFPGDGKIDPVIATTTFFRAAAAKGAKVVDGVGVTALRTKNNRVTDVITGVGEVSANEVVLAVGAWTPQLAATAGVHVPVFPGKGQMLATEPLPPVTSRVLRAEKLGTRQLSNGEMLVGSEVELAGYNKAVNQATVESYLHFMQELVPALRDARVARTWGCLRPMSIDQLPIIGSVMDVAGLHLNTGHGRSGMGLAPASAKALVDVLLTGQSDLDLGPYSPNRFANM